MVTLFTIAEVCKQLGIGDDIVRAAIADGRLKAVRFGHRTVRVSQASIDDYILASSDDSAAEHLPHTAPKPQPATKRNRKKKS